MNGCDSDMKSSIPMPLPFQSSHLQPKNRKAQPKKSNALFKWMNFTIKLSYIESLEYLWILRK
jgi:hypothetical protein